MRRSKVSLEDLSISRLWLILQLARDHVSSPTRSLLHRLKRSVSKATFGCLEGIGQESWECHYVGNHRDLRTALSATTSDCGKKHTMLNP